MTKPPINLEKTEKDLTVIYSSMSSMEQRQGDGQCGKYLPPVKNSLNMVMGIASEKPDLKAATVPASTKVSHVSGTTFHKSPGNATAKAPEPSQKTEDSSRKFGSR